MGISTALQAAHNDDLHTGNAKRAAASGLASLDAASKVVQEPATKGLASGIASLDASSKVVQEPVSKGAASGIASLDASSKVVQEPASKAVASGLASLDASSMVVQEPASKGAASGIATLDASSRVPAAQLALAELLANKNAASGYAGLDASILLTLAQQRLNFKIGTTIYNTATASGNQAITGVGFRPRLVIFQASVDGNVGQMSIGFSDGTNHYCIYDGYQMLANTYFTAATKCIDLVQSGAISCFGTINSLDADGFTIAWTKAGAKIGDAAINYIAIK